MHQKLPRITGREIIGLLGKAGWYKDDQEGSHCILRHNSKPGKIIVPVHSGKIIGPGLLREIIEQAGLTRKQFIGLRRRKRK